MNVHTESFSFSGEKELLRFLGDLPIAPQEKLGLIAGHFMLMYDDRRDELVPMIHQDSDNPRVVRFSKLMAGDFPIRSFALGCKLQKQYASEGADSQIVLIVNDHIFTSPGWHKQNLPDFESGAALRHNYYRKKYPLPQSYFKMLKAADLSTEVVLSNDNSRRTPQNILPKKTRLFSEQTLRNSFDKSTRYKLRILRGFREDTIPGSKSRLLFTANGEMACLADGTSCGCSGELIEFLRELAARGFTRIVFFVPSECWLAAGVGFSAFLHLPKSHNKALSSICAISGLGGMSSTDGDESSISVIAYQRA